ncbi:MAG: DUF4145 domain-containing protein [Alphaproteobacteria bacterium]|nr:DUF4145 domain-containing protein [Alphaproteobacteria bacterium]
MREIYTAVENGLSTLAAMGIRTVLEMTMIDKVGDQGNFKKNLDAFHKAGYLSVRQYQIVDNILEAGHAAAHRGWTPSVEDIQTLLGITESTIESSHLHEDLARKLAAKTPVRPRPSRRSSEPEAS